MNYLTELDLIDDSGAEIDEMEKVNREEMLLAGEWDEAFGDREKAFAEWVAEMEALEDR